MHMYIYMTSLLMLENIDIATVYFTHSVITSFLRFVIKNVSYMHSVASMFSDSLEMFLDDYHQDIYQRTLTTISSDHLPIIVQLGSSFQIDLPKPPHQIFTDFKKVDWGSCSRKISSSFRDVTHKVASTHY